MKFCFENLTSGREYKNGCRQATFGLENEKKFNLNKIYWKCFFPNFKIKILFSLDINM